VADVQISSGKIQSERTLYNGHFENLRSVVDGEQLRCVEAQNGYHRHFFEPLLRGFFPQIKLGTGHESFSSSRKSSRGKSG